ncbi:MAG: DPP IV N-terminal domain-containing protein [FCB group bacterium]|jgi:TolB protein|nr:DPP IV N-terminal domain-containing protein [FCB group bacterium]
MSIRILAATMIVTALAGVAAAQSAPKQITFGDCRDRDPVVSPDGNFMAFSSDRTGNDDIYLVSFGKSGFTQMTQEEKDDRYPSWSADSKNIIFCSKRTGKGDIYQIGRDKPMSVAFTSSDMLDEYPSLNPKDSSLVFAQGVDKKFRTRPQMHVVLAKTTADAQAPSTLAEGDEPSFSPDGKKIVFVSRRTKNNDVWLMNVDGSAQTQLTTDEKDDENPRFSPDGKHIVFASKRTGNFDIWVMDVDGRNLRQLTSSPADETQPCWSVGGYLYYVLERGEGKSNVFQLKAPTN